MLTEGINKSLIKRGYDSSNFAYSNPDDASSCQCAPILITDDNEFNVITLKKILFGLGFQTDQANNGEEAIVKVTKSLQCCPYKLIFMD